jgi:hypothetical protein
MMDGPYGMQGKKDDCIQCIGVKTLRKGDHSEDEGVAGRTTLQWFFK